MNLLDTITIGAVASVIWPLCRVGGFFMTMFVVSGRTVPMRIRLLAAAAFTLCILPSIPALPDGLAPFSGIGILITIKEVLIGACIGFMTQFISQCFVLAGQTVAMQTGLGFASLVDPVSGTNTPVVGQFFTVLTTLVFLAIDGHIIFFRMLLMSFVTLPQGGEFISPVGLREMVEFGTMMFSSALAMAMSAICTMLVVNFTFGVMTRAAPQLNVFSMGFAVSMVVGLFIVRTSLNAYLNTFTMVFNEVMTRTCSLIGTSCEGILQ